jgi:IS30 family transposase
MNQDNLQAEAEKLLQLMRDLPPRELGEKLRPIDEATILELAAAGKSQTEIAQIVGCNQSTVSRTLAEWADSRGLARKYAEAKSLEMMQRFVKKRRRQTSSRCRRSWMSCARTRKWRATQGL